MKLTDVHRPGPDTVARMIKRSRLDHSVTHERHILAVRHGDHEGTLIVPWPPNRVASTPDASPPRRHDPQNHVLVGRMAGDRLVVRQKDQPFSVRRGMRKPVDE